VYWFVSPPYARYAAAALIVLVALWMDLRPAPVDLRLVARQDISAGTELDRSQFESSPMPAGMFTAVEPTGVAAIGISKGDLLLSSHVAAVAPPDGWWVVLLPVPPGVRPGTDLRVVLLTADPTKEPEAVPGLVIVPPDRASSGFGDPEGSVAIPEDAVERVAAAVSAGRVIVLSR
jgi:hypothetical protein